MLMVFQDVDGDMPIGEPYPLRVSFGLWLHGEQWAADNYVQFENDDRDRRGDRRRVRFVSFNR